MSTTQQSVIFLPGIEIQQTTLSASVGECLTTVRNHIVYITQRVNMYSLCNTWLSVSSLSYWTLQSADDNRIINISIIRRSIISCFIFILYVFSHLPKQTNEHTGSIFCTKILMTIFHQRSIRICINFIYQHCKRLSASYDSIPVPVIVLLKCPGICYAMSRELRCD